MGPSDSAEDYGIYLACIDLSAFVVSDSADTDGDEKDKEFEASNTWQAMEWWLASIAVHAPNSPVAIVGTHNDCTLPIHFQLTFVTVRTRERLSCYQ